MLSAMSKGVVAHEKIDEISNFDHGFGMLENKLISVFSTSGPPDFETADELIRLGADVNAEGDEDDENTLSEILHGSQGREWKTVVLSVVDTTKKWFTDSNNAGSEGKNLINTAVSRAKDELIIVCDYDYWTDKDQESQLLYKLLMIAKPYKEPLT